MDPKASLPLDGTRLAPSPLDEARARVPRLLLAAIAVLALHRVVYHVAYLLYDPFARVTLSDGQLYEEAARDILAHAPLGTQPLYLQGLYAYFLALGMALRGELLDALGLQLLLAAAALVLFARAASRRFGARAGAFSTLLLLACPSLAYYENKYLSASLGVFCNAWCLFAFVALSAKPTRRAALLLGVASGLAMLGRPNLLFALPFTALGVWFVARAKAEAARPLLVQLVLGVVLALAPMAARNLLVTGRASVFASHGGGIPFYIGNGPRANGLWNDGGGLLSGQVWNENTELAGRLGIRAHGDALDQAVGHELYARALAFVREEPGAWLALEAKKLRYTLGNPEFTHDYDLLGERELLGLTMPIGFPFGIVLGLGAFGLLQLARRRPDEPEAVRCSRVAMLLVLSGQVVAVLLANLIWFTASQHRMPLVLPLAFAAGPALAAGFAGLSRTATRHAEPRVERAQLWAAAVALLLTAQAFWPGRVPTRPTSIHYYNLANAEEDLGRNQAALAHYRKAVARNPRQPMFLLRQARMARLLRSDDEAEEVLARLLALPDLPPPIRNAARDEEKLLLDRRAGRAPTR